MFTWLKNKMNDGLDWTGHQFKQYLNFTWFAEITAARAPWQIGIIPPIKTILALLAFSGAIAGGLWLWGGLWTGVYASLSSFVPVIGKTLAATLGFTFLNFWFKRDIDAAMNSTRDIRDDVLYGPTNPVNVYKLVNHLRHEVNAHFRKKLGDKARDIPVPVLLTTTDDGNFKIITSEGRNPGKAGIIFSSGAFDMRRMDQRHLAALIEKELIKIYLRRGVYRTIVAMLTDLSSTLENLKTSEHMILRVLGALVTPFQFFLLWEKSINRTFEYEASKEVVECGRGYDLIGAMDRKVCNTQVVFPMKTTFRRNQELHKREPYQGHGPIKWLADWVDQHEYPGADKTGSRFFAFFDAVVNYALYLINELWNKLPRSTNEKIFVGHNVKTKIGDREVTMENASEAEKEIIRTRQIEINRDLHKEVVKSIRHERDEQIAIAKRRKMFDLIPSIKERFTENEVISPDGTGISAPIINAIPEQTRERRVGAPILHTATRKQPRGAPVAAPDRAHRMKLRHHR
jgi:hypothetical protein